MSANLNVVDFEQGSYQWLAVRKTKITATDAPIIMGVSIRKTPLQLYKDKLAPVTFENPTPPMLRGINLEPIARDLYNMKTGFNMQPVVIVKDWLMASLDGQDPDTGNILEIKCPGASDHDIALSGKVPDHYYPQLQHQMYLADVQMMDYFSFDGVDGVIVKVKRDDKYIEKMLIEEKNFFDRLQNKIPPEATEKDFIERDDEIWNKCASKWQQVTQNLKELEKEEEELRKQLIFLSGESNAKGGGISLCLIRRKGFVDYSKIPQLKDLDLEIYRKPTTTSWRINCT